MPHEEKSKFKLKEKKVTENGDLLETLLYNEFFLLDTKNKNVPIFSTMQIESSSSQPFVPLFKLLQLNERNAKQKSGDEIIS